MDDAFSTNVWTTMMPADSSIVDVAETLVGMANSRGGTLLLEIGQATVEDAIDRVREASLLADPMLILPLPVPIEDNTIAVTVPRGLPHVFAVDGRYLARDGAV